MIRGSYPLLHAQRREVGGWEDPGYSLLATVALASGAQLSASNPVAYSVSIYISLNNINYVLFGLWSHYLPPFSVYLCVRKKENKKRVEVVVGEKLYIREVLMASKYSLERLYTTALGSLWYSDRRIIPKLLRLNTYTYIRTSVCYYTM